MAHLEENLTERIYGDEHDFSIDEGPHPVSDLRQEASGYVVRNPAREERRHALCLLYQETRDDTVFNILYEELLPMARKVCAMRARDDTTADELFNMLGSKKILVAVEKWRPDYPDGRILVSFLKFILGREITNYYKSSRYRAARRGRSLDAVSKGGDGQKLQDKVPGGDLREEVEVGADASITRYRVRGLLRAVIYTKLSPLQRRSMERWIEPGRDKPRTQQEIANEHGLTRAAISIQEVRGRQRIAKVLSRYQEDDESLTGAQPFLLKRFLPELFLDQDQGRSAIDSLHKVGVLLREDGRIDLKETTENKFYVAIFCIVDGTKVSGAQLLANRGMASLFELFTGPDIDERLCVLPESTTDPFTNQKLNKDLTPDDYLAMARHPENLRRLVDKFGVHLRKDGKWHVSVRTADFNRKWLLINEHRPAMGGGNLLRQFGLSLTQDNIGKIFEMIFGSENLHFVKRCKGRSNFMKYLGEARFIAELKDKKNSLAWADGNVSFTEDGDQKYCYIHIGGGRNPFVAKAKFNIDGQICSGGIILKEFGLGTRPEDVRTLCKKVFPDHKVRFSFPSAEKEPSQDEILNEFCQATNKNKLRSVAQSYKEDRLLLAVPEEDGVLRHLCVNDFIGRQFMIFNRIYIGLDRILEKLNSGRGIVAIAAIYKKAFGNDKVITKDEMDPLTEAEILSDLKKPGNVEELRGALDELPDKRLQIPTSRAGLKPCTLVVGGKKVGLIRLLLDDLKWGTARNAIIRLYTIVIGKQHISVDMPKKSHDEILSQMKTRDARATLKAATVELSGGRLLLARFDDDLGHYVELKANLDFGGLLFDIFNKHRSIRKVLKLLGRGVGYANLIWLYQEVFGQGAIMTLVDLERVQINKEIVRYPVC